MSSNEDMTDPRVGASGDAGISSEGIQMSWQEKYAEALKNKNLGNEQYKAKSYVPAIGKYHRALMYLKGIQENQKLSFAALMPTKPSTLPAEAKKQVDQLTCDCYNNIAACILASDKPSYQRVLERSEQCLKLSPKNAKAMYRKGVALYHLNKPDEALEVLKQASTLPGGSKDANITRYVGLCKEKQVEHKETEKLRCKAMFSSNSDTEQVKASS